MLGTAALKSSSLLLCKKYSSKIPLEKKKKKCSLKNEKKKKILYSANSKMIHTLFPLPQHTSLWWDDISCHEPLLDGAIR